MPDFPPEHPTARTAVRPILETLENGERSAVQTLDAGEECVSQHPASAITSAFVGGLVVGALIGWGIAESRHRTYRDACRELASDWMHRLHLD